MHGQYRRQLADQSCFGVPVTISVEIRRFKCSNAGCKLRTFAEPVDDLATRRQRRTKRLSGVLRRLGYALGGVAAGRLAAYLGISVSAIDVQRPPRPLLNRHRTHSVARLRAQPMPGRLAGRVGTAASANRATTNALSTLCAASSPSAPAWARNFLGLIHRGDVAGFDRWLDRAINCSVPEMRRFAVSLRMDLAAVRAAYSSPWSSGQVEGQVNRLKFLERQLYGRASLELMRLRVLHPN